MTRRRTSGPHARTRAAHPPEGPRTRLNWGTPTFPTPYYPLARLGEGATVVRAWPTPDGAGALVVLAALSAK